MHAIFLDRDGVINANRPDHVKSWDEFVFLPGALDGLRLLRQAGWTTVVITNQSIIRRKMAPQWVVDDIHARMCQVVEQHGGRIDAVYYCPHRPEDNCACRKPQPEMLLRAALQFGLQLDQCYLIGDAWTDIAAGQAVGCRCALVKTGRGQQQLRRAESQQYHHYHITSNLATAVRWALRQEERRGLGEQPDGVWSPTHLPLSDLPVTVS